jgi:hypothetical protein
MELKQRHECAAPPVPPLPSREELSGQLDAAPSRLRLPADEFADTLPSLQYAHADELLVR